MSDIYLANVLSVTILITAGHSTTLASGASVSSPDILTQGKHCDYSVMFESSATTEPTMKQLLTSVVPRIAAEWDKVAHYLEFTIPSIKIIRRQYKDDPKECCYHLLEEWIGTDQGVIPKNWTTLLSVLKQIKELTSVCNEIEKDLKL